MRSVLKYILLFNILFTVLQSEAQYIDTLCINTLGRGYHVFGLPGSTYTWNIPGGTPAPVSVDDTIFVNWGSVPGVYTISVIEHSKDGCDGKLVVGDVRLVNNPYVYAGNNATICADSNVTLSNSDSNYCTSILWTTSGDGLFSNTGILHPVYTPGPADIFAGFVNLTLTGKGLGQTCPNASSVVTITIIKPVIASAGPDVSACAITPYTITGATAANYASLLWTHNGAGTLQNHTTINPTYIPAPGEVGTVTFTLQAFSISPCHQTVIDQMIMTIFPLPTGTFVLLSKDSICGEDTVRLRIDLTGTPPWTFTYTDGTTTTTVTNLFTTPYYITTFPDSSVTYTVTTLSDANCTTFPGTQNTVSVLVHPKPPVEYTWQIGPQNYEVQFHIDSSIVDLGAVGYMVVWNFGDGTFGYGHNPIHFYPGSTTFHCILTITDTNGCSNSVMHEIFVPPVQIAFYSSNSPTCLGTPMCFQDLSTVPNPPATYIQTWIWNFGDGTPPDTIHFPNNPNVCHTYAVIGTYPVTLTIRDNWGTTSSYVHDQIVIPDPIAVFTYTSNCEHQPVQFTDATQLNGGGIIMSWNWDFDDPTSGINNTSILQNPIHSFTGGNTFYNVRLIIQNFNGCRDTLVRPVYILQKPPVEFTRDSACNGQVVHYVADAGIMHVDSIVTWSWDFGDGSQPSTNPVTATHTFTAPGTYITTLTVTDIHGCFNSVSHGVKVNPLPIPVFSWSSPVCSGSPVHFTDNSTVPLGYTGYIAKWFWEFGDGTSQLITLPGSPNVTHTFIGTASTHNVRLTVWTNDSCSQFVEHVVQTIPAPIADFNSSNVRCENQPVQFTDISQTNGGGSINQWSWNFDDPGSGINNTSGLQNPLHTYVNSGTYMVSLIVTNATGCTDTIVKAVDVKVAPVANFRADTACLHSVTQFTDLSVPNGANIISYSWDFGDGTAPAHMQNPTHIYAISGIFNVKLSIVNSNGCTKDTTKPVLVNPLPNAEFSYSAPNCFGAVVQYTNLSTTPPGYLGSIVKWVWDFGDGTSNTILAPNNPDVSHTFAGTALSHVVRLTVTTSDGCMSFVEHTINSIPSPVADFGFPGINCATQSVQFTDLSHTNNGGPIISWHWNFGDPVSGFSNTSTLQSPVHLFTGPGTYNVTLIVNNASSCSDTISKSITISPSPLANFTADTACLHQPTQFTDNSVPNAASIITYAWDFGDGSPISSLPNPTHTFTSYGVQNVKLTITNSNGCIGEITKQVLVHPLPLPEFTFTTANCHGSSVQFTDASSTVIGYLGSIVQWVWDFGDGTPPVTIVAPGNPNVSHVFAGSANSYVVRLTVTTSDGCSDFKEHTVSTNASPIADFTYPSGSCDQQSIQFTDISQSNGGGTITQWHWDFGDPGSGFFNTSSIQNPGHNFSSPGTYTVTEIIYTESGCSDTTTHSVTVISSPLADFVADTACFGSPTTFTDQSTSPSGIITQYIWHFGDGTTSLQKNPVHTYLTDGIHQVTLRVTTQYGCTKEITKPVLVVPRPVATFSATTPVCLGSLVYFTDNSVSLFGTIQTWSWDFGDGTIVNINAPLSPNVNHLYQIAGTYTVVLRITTSHGCIATTSNPVVIQPAPIANFAFSTARCENSPVQFTDMSNPNGGSPVTQWLWNFNDPASGSSNSSNIQNPVHLFTGTGTYNVSLTVTTSNGCTNTTSKPVTVSAKPIAQFSSDTACAGNATHFTDHSVANAAAILSWHWNFGDPSSGTNNTSTLKNPSHIFAAPGNYLVRLTVINSNNCEKDTVMSVPVPTAPAAMFQYTASCVNTATQFTDMSTSQNSQITSWYWDFGDGVGTSTLQNPQYTYTTSGTFNVKLRVTNAGSCADSIILPVVSHPVPVAEFNYTSFFCPSGQVIFHDISHGVGTSIASRLWIFEPGSTSTQHDPTYVFPVTDTNYLVTLIVTDNFGCIDTTEQNVYVKPGFSFTFTHDTACFTTSTHFHAHNNTVGDSLYFLQWNFGDPASGINNTSTLRNPTHIFTSAGTFAVKLKARNSDNCADSVMEDIVVDAWPLPAYSYTSQPCDSLTLFTDHSTAGTGTIASWKWNFGDGSPVQTIVPPGNGNTTHVFTQPGTFQVILTITNSHGCSDTISKLVTRPSCISASFTQNVPAACSKVPVTFTDNSQPVSQINLWYWSFGDGMDTIYPNYAWKIKHTYTISGTYQVKLRIRAAVSGQTYSDSATSMVTIHPAPETQFTSDPVCLNKITLFKDMTNTFGTDITTWRWNFGDPASGNNNFSGAQDPNHKYNSTGSYNVSLMVTNKDGCKDSLVKSTKVFALPGAKFINTLACSDNPTYFFDKSIVIDTAIANWHWNFGVPKSKKDTSQLRNPAYEFKDAGNYDVLLIVKDFNGCYDSVDSMITVHPSPLSAFIVMDNISGMSGKLQLRNKSEGADSYFWDFGNGQTSTDENPFVTFNHDGSYTIMLVSSTSFGCADTSFYKYDMLFKGLYVPNAFVPGSGIDGIRLFKPVGVNLITYHVQVIDSWGHLLWESSALDAQGRPTEGWDGRMKNGQLYEQGTYVWKINAQFMDGTTWEGSDNGKSEPSTMGTVTLIR